MLLIKLVKLQLKRFYVSIGKVLEINNVNLSDDNICGNKPLSIYVKRNYTDMDESLI